MTNNRQPDATETPAGSQNPSDEDTNTGLSPRTAAAASYAAWWLTGGLLLIVEPSHPFVRFHAKQALIGFGAIWLVGALAWGVSFASAFVSTTLFRVATLMAEGFWVAALVLWVVCVVKAWRGERWALPGLSRWIREAASQQPSAAS